MYCLGLKAADDTVMAHHVLEGFALKRLALGDVLGYNVPVISDFSPRR